MLAMKVPRPPVTPMERACGIMADPPDNPTHTLDPRIQRQLRRAQLHPSPSRRGFTRIPALAYTSVDHGYDVLDVPTEWNSPQHLQFCGLRPEVAGRFFAEWRVRNGEGDGWLKGNAVDECLVDVALGGMRSRRYEELYASDDWEGALRELGLAEDVVAAIMDPRYDEVRELGDPFYWAKDTIATNHNFLLELTRRIRARKDYFTDLLRARDGEARPAPLDPEPKAEPGTCMYYIPLAAHAVGKLFDVFNNAHPGFVSSGSELHPSAQHYIHLLKERSVAEGMARYTAARCRAKEAVVLHVPVPESVVALARDHAMSWEDWRRLVWLSKNKGARKESGGKLPPKLQRHADRPVVEVPLCGLSEERISALPSESDVEPLRLDDGSGASQLVLQSHEARRLWYTYASNEIWPEWITDVASEVEATFIGRADVPDVEWRARMMDCWNGWRWNVRPAYNWV